MSAIKPGQVYVSCDPREHIRIKVVRCRPEGERVDVVDAATGKRPRSIKAAELHDSGTTRTGEPRRRGYRLVQDVEGD